MFDLSASGFGFVGSQMDTAAVFVPWVLARGLVHTNSTCSEVGAWCIVADFDLERVAVQHHPHHARQSSTLWEISMFLSCVGSGLAAVVSVWVRALIQP